MYSSNFNSRVEKIGSSDKDGDFDIIYYNATIINSKSSGSLNFNDDPALRFQEARNVPIIHNAKKYEFSVIKFQLNGANKNLPLFIPQIQIGQSNYNLTTYSLGLSLNRTFLVAGSTYTFNSYVNSYISFVPENQQYLNNTNNVYGNLPSAPLTAQDLNNTYYYVYNYDHFVTLVNNTINSVYTSLIAKFNAYVSSVGGASQSITTYAPYMTFDASTQLFSIYYDSFGFGGTSARSFGATPTTTTGAEAMNLYFNNNLMGLFSSFDNNSIAPLNFESSIVIPTTAATGSGTAATLSFTALPFPPFAVGQLITVATIVPTGYRATNVAVTACTTSSVSYLNATTGAQTVAGTISATYSAIPATIATTAASGTGTTATISFTALSFVPFTVGQLITVTGITPLGYNATNVAVTACTTNSVSYLNATTGAQTIAGVISGSYSSTIFSNAVDTNENYLLTVANKLNSNIYLPNTILSIVPTFPTYGSAYYKMTQNFVCTSSLWSPVAAVVLTSSQIPVENEEVSALIQDGDSNDLSSSSSNNFAPIIADMSLKATTAADYSNLIFYEPNGEYRMSSMMGGSNNSLANIDLVGYWRCRLDNNLYPLKMFNNSSASIKILFRKKKN